jgi:hypothetical protein
MKATKRLYTLPWLLLFPFLAHAGDVPGTYAAYQWDPAVTALTSIDYTVDVEADPGYRANVRWATRFVLSGTGEIGRAGMEDNANVGPNFVFTVRGATQYKTGAAGSYCVVHTGDDARVTCRLPYHWINTEPYQFHVAYEGGQWLGVTVTDAYHPTLSFKLGSILTDATSISPQGMVSRTAYLEASSPNSNCFNQGYSQATFNSLAGNGGQYTASISNAGADTACVNSSGVIHSGSYSEHTNGFGNLPRGEVVGEDNLCMDAADGLTNDVAVTSQNCNEKSEGQAWVFGKDGTVRLQSNLCLDVANADPSPGAAVVADQCNGSAGQLWTLGGFNNNIQSNINGYCLTEGAAGTQLTMQDCSAGPTNSQFWTVPQIPVLP